MKTIERFHERNERSSLTVTPTRITIKFRVGCTEVERKLTEEFFLQVAEAFNEYKNSLRGQLNQKYWFRLQNSDKSKKFHFPVPDALKVIIP